MSSVIALTRSRACGKLRVTMAKEKSRPEKGAPADLHVGVRLKESLRHRAKVLAAKEKRDLQELLDEALDDYLKKRSA